MNIVYIFYIENINILINYLPLFHSIYYEHLHHQQLQVPMLNMVQTMVMTMLVHIFQTIKNYVLVSNKKKNNT